MNNKSNNTTISTCGNKTIIKTIIKETINIFDNKDNDNNSGNND